MLSDQALHYVSNYFQYCEIFILFPYKWDKNSKNFKKQSSRFRYMFYNFSLVWYTFECVYASIALYHVFRNVNSTFQYTVKVMLHVFSRIASLLLHYGLVLNKERLANFFNKAVRMNSNFTGKNSP